MKKVLVIDDNVDTLTVIQLILSAEGYIVRSFSRWKEGFEQVNSFMPDIILLDVHLGTADGRNLAKQLKYKADTKHIPIILFSSNHNIIASLVECEAEDFIAKPIQINSLIEKVNLLIGAAKK